MELGMAGQSFLFCNALVAERSTCLDVRVYVCARAIFQRLLYQNLCRSDQYILYDSDDSEPMWKLGLTSEFLEGGQPPWYFKTPDLESGKLREAAWIAWQIYTCLNYSSRVSASVVGHRWHLNGAWKELWTATLSVGRTGRCSILSSRAVSLVFLVYI